jgi:2-polyprenyl-6-methoxyphenol hydroxylase-like FAD-dependent oxidoreductase
VRGQDRAVLIIGGGPAGLATAIELARLNVAAVVVERSAYDDRRLGEHLTPAGALQLRAFDRRRPTTPTIFFTPVNMD